MERTKNDGFEVFVRYEGGRRVCERVSYVLSWTVECPSEKES